MHNQVMLYLTRVFQAAVNFVEQIVSAVPGARSAIIWGTFVVLSFGFLIIPLRGSGASELASAKASYYKAQNKKLSNTGIPKKTPRSGKVK